MERTCKLPKGDSVHLIRREVKDELGWSVFITWCNRKSYTESSRPMVDESSCKRCLRARREDELYGEEIKP